MVQRLVSSQLIDCCIVVRIQLLCLGLNHDTNTHLQNSQV